MGCGGENRRNALLFPDLMISFVLSYTQEAGIINNLTNKCETKGGEEG